MKRTKGPFLKKVYLVKFNGYTGGYGSMNYLLGIYDSEDKAKEAFECFTEKHPELSRFNKIDAAIKSVKLNKTYGIIKDPWFGSGTSIYLGGYCE